MTTTRTTFALIALVFLVSAPTLACSGASSDDATERPAPESLPNDRLAFEPGWTRLPDPPLSPRNDTTSVWTGDEIVVVGGWEFSCPPNADCVQPREEPFADGAAFDPESSTWRPIADAPTGFIDASAVSIDGDVYFFTPSGLPRPSVLVRYRSGDDAWDRLPIPRKVLGGTLVAAGDSLVLASGHGPAGETRDWILDLATESWRELPEDPLPPSYDRSVLWYEGDLLVFAKPTPAPGDRGLSPIVGARLDLSTGEWELLPPSGTSGFQAWLVDDVVVINPHFSRDAGGGIFDLRTRSWSPLPPHPLGAAWSGDIAGVLGRDGAVFGASGSWVLDLTRSSWVEIVAPEDGPVVGGIPTAVGRGRVFLGEVAGDPLALDAWIWMPEPPPRPTSTE